MIKLSAAIVLLLLLGSCQHSAHAPATPATSDSVPPSGKLVVDTAVSELKAMLVYFHKNGSGQVDADTEIDKDLIKKIFNDTVRLWDNINSIIPVDMVENATGSFFIVQLNCGAGAECKEFYLIGFSGGRAVQPEKLGSNLADEDFEKTFDDKIVGDSAIIVSTKYYDNSTLKNSSVVRFPLRFEHDRLAEAKELKRWVSK